MLEDLSHDSTLASLQGNLPGKHPANRMLLQYFIYMGTLKKSSSILIDEENSSKARLLCVDGLEMFTVNPARPEEVGAISSFKVRNLTISKSTKEIWSILWAAKSGKNPTAPLFTETRFINFWGPDTCMQAGRLTLLTYLYVF